MANAAKEGKELSSEDQLRFKWLQFGTRGTTYTSYNEFQNLPASSFDFGADGYTGSINHGGELLQMAAPSDTHGIIFARGDFGHSLYSTLARAQRTEGGKYSFGLKLGHNKLCDPTMRRATRASNSEEQSVFRLGPITERGCFNYRWPVHEYSLLLNEEEVKETGTCTSFSFVKDGILYQLLHLEQVYRPEFNAWYFFPTDGKINLLVGGLVNFKTYHSCDPESENEEVRNRKTKCLDAEDSTTNEWRCEEHRDGSESPDGNPSLQLKCQVFQLEEDGGWKVLPLAPSDDLSNPCQYQAEGSLPDIRAAAFRDRRVTFLAAFRLSDGMQIDRIPSPPSPQEIYRYVGIGSGHEDATGAMWQAIFLEKTEKSYNTSELSEVNLVARCFEKILHVDMVPASFKRKNATIQSLALVSNMFVQAEVDMKALFWKIRYLVKVHNFLHEIVQSTSPILSVASQWDRDIAISTLSTSTDKPADVKHFPNEEENKCRIANAQMKRIDKVIQDIFTFLYQAYLMEPTEMPLRSTSALYNNTLQLVDNYYVMITLWYVIHKYKCFDSKWIPLRAGSAKKSFLWTEGLPPDNCPFDQTSKLRVTLLQWFHYASILKLLSYDGGAIHSEWLPSYSDSTNEINQTIEAVQMVGRLRTTAKIAFASRMSSRKPYTTWDEVDDRLAFLVDELGFEDGSGDTASMASLATKRLKHRCFTTEINPGTAPSSPLEEISTSGPWEIHALCHHGRLYVAHLDRKAAKDQDAHEKCRKEVEKYKRKFCKFLTSDALLVPCWERTNLMAERGWLRSEATSVLASTLIEICEYDLRQSNLSERVNNIDVGSPTLTDDRLVMMKLMTEQTQMLERLAHPNVPSEKHVASPIDWEKYTPPRQYHPDSFFNSLVSTPEVYAKGQAGPLPMDSTIHTYLKTLFTTVWTTKDWLEKIEKLRSTSVVDIKSCDTTLKNNASSTMGRKTMGPYRIKIVGALNSIANYGSDGELQTVAGPSLPPLALGANKELERCLSESLVDQAVQHRILITPELEDNIVGLLAYILHPESTIFLYHHAHGISRFISQKGDSWTTGITLKCWSTVEEIGKRRMGLITSETLYFPGNDDDCGSDEDMKGRDYSNDNHHIFLPKELKNSLRKIDSDAYTREINQPRKIILDVSSFVLDTNAFGDFSKCTIISAILPPYKLIQLASETPKVWQEFIHQPHTARCHVFLLILGALCSEMGDRYRTAVKYVHSLPHLDDFLIGNESKWVQSKDRLARLKLTLWCFGAVSRMRNSLDQSMRGIEHAKAELVRQIRHAPGKRSEALERIHQDHLTNFENSLEELKRIERDLDQKIDMLGRNRDAVSTQLALMDSQRLIRQGRTIQRLTYLTIAYLPFGLAAAIFTIPDTQQVVQDNMGWRWYVGSGFFMMLATFAIALFVPWFLDLIPDPVSFIGGGGGGGGLLPPPQPMLPPTSNDDGPDKGPCPPPPGAVDSSDDGYHSTTNHGSSLGSFRRWKREAVIPKNDVEKGW